MTSASDSVGVFVVNSLSRGEKSYAQMCLIASLWENMNPTFRDVFLEEQEENVKNFAWIWAPEA